LVLINIDNGERAITWSPASGHWRIAMRWLQTIGGSASATPDLKRFKDNFALNPDPPHG
jgi:hypothetical protein